MNPTQYEPGRWHLVCLDEDGFVFNEHLVAWCDWSESTSDTSFYDTDGSPATIMIVQESAVPRSQSDNVDDFHRSPGVYASRDVAAEWDVEDLTGSEIMLIWNRARPMTQGLNHEKGLT
jgi:hypothetical protein